MKKNRQSFPKLRWLQNKPTNPMRLKYGFFAVSVNPSSLDPANNLITVGTRHLPTVHCQLPTANFLITTTSVLVVETFLCDQSTAQGFHPSF